MGSLTSRVCLGLRHFPGPWTASAKTRMFQTNWRAWLQRGGRARPTESWLCSLPGNRLPMDFLCWVNVLCSKRDLGILSCYLQPRASYGQRLGSSNYPCVTDRSDGCQRQPATRSGRHLPAPPLVWAPAPHHPAPVPPSGSQHLLLIKYFFLLKQCIKNNQSLLF